MQTGIFLLLYAGLRLFVDLFREYPTTLLGLATGQVLNLAMASIGLLLIVVSCWRGRRSTARANDPTLGHPAVIETPPHCWQPAAFVLLLASCS